MEKRYKNSNKSIQPIIGYNVLKGKKYLVVSELSNFFQVPDEPVKGITYKKPNYDNTPANEKCVDFVEIDCNASTWKMAKTYKDFEIIFNREFEKTKFEDSEGGRRSFCIRLWDYLARLESKSIDYFNKEDPLSELLGTIDLFKEWLSKKAGIPLKSNLEEKGRKELEKNTTKLNKLIKDLREKNIDDGLLTYGNTNIVKQRPTGFQSSLNNEQIENLYSQMNGNYFEVIPEHFKAIFKNEPLPFDFIPIKRLKPFTTALCAYFVSELFQKENPNDYWSIAKNCIVAKNLKQSLNNVYQLNPNHKPKGYENIDTILKNIYHPLQ